MREAKVLIHKGKNGKFYWSLRAENGSVVAEGSRGHATYDHARKAWIRVQNLAMVKLTIPIERAA